MNGFQDLREPIGDGPRLARPARDLDQSDGRVDEPPPIDDAVDEELREFIERAKASFPDSNA